MALNLTPPDISELKPRITVFGVGGAGGNAVNNMITAGLQGVDFVVANTDAQALTMSKAQRIVQMGTAVTQGLGAERPRRALRRRLTTHRPRRTRHPDSRPARAGRTSARLWPAAQRGEERRVRGARRTSRLPAICSPRACRTAALAAAGQDGHRRLFRKGRTMATRGLLMTDFRNSRLSPTPAAAGRGEPTRT